MALCAAAFLAAATPALGRDLTICADPNNLPFSNERGEGLENRLAEMLAREMGGAARTVWWAQRGRAFLRDTLGAGRCEALLGVTAGMGGVLTTRPYYRSGYVFVTRRSDNLQPEEFGDPRLEALTIGIPVTGMGYYDTPPAILLGRHGLADRLRPFAVTSDDYEQPNPPAHLIEAVASGEVDVAVAWGPLAGYFAPRQGVPLWVGPALAEAEGVPLSFDISVAVAKSNPALRDELDRALDARRQDIARLLSEYGVPLLPARAGGAISPAKAGVP